MRQDVRRLERPGFATAFRQGDRLLQIRLRRYQLTGIGQRARQIRQRHGNMAVVQRALLTANQERLLEEGDRARAQALASIGEADAFEHLSAYFRLQALIPRDLFRAAIEQILGRRLLALSVEGVGSREYIHHERRHLLRPVAFLDSGFPRQFNAMIFPEHDTPKECESQEYRGDARDRPNMPPQKLDRVVAPVTLPGANGLPLQMPTQEPLKSKETPAVEFLTNEKPLEETVSNIKIPAQITALRQELEPRLVEAPEHGGVQRKTGPVVVMPAKMESRVIIEQPVDKKIVHEPIEWIFSQETVPPATSGGYLIRPANIYDDEPCRSESLPEELPLKDLKIFTASVKNPPQEENPPADMQLVFKDEIPAADVPGAHQTQTDSMANQPAEEPALQDEAEGLRRRAADRINKLRNLSFNMNAADPNNEFETVPAYIRRNLELYNTVTSVESFYSQYEVKADKNSHGEISTINSFLDGKKPD